jgi:hypothetical protein
MKFAVILVYLLEFAVILVYLLESSHTTNLTNNTTVAYNFFCRGECQLNALWLWRSRLESWTVLRLKRMMFA